VKVSTYFKLLCRHLLEVIEEKHENVRQDMGPRGRNLIPDLEDMKRG